MNTEGLAAALLHLLSLISVYFLIQSDRVVHGTDDRVMVGRGPEAEGCILCLQRRRVPLVNMCQALAHPGLKV